MQQYDNSSQNHMYVVVGDNVCCFDLCSERPFDKTVSVSIIYGPPSYVKYQLDINPLMNFRHNISLGTDNLPMIG